jgi:hypothetical protein
LVFRLLLPEYPGLRCSLEPVTLSNTKCKHRLDIDTCVHCTSTPMVATSLTDTLLAQWNRRNIDLLACPNCGNSTPRRQGTCCDGACRVALHRWRHSDQRGWPYTEPYEAQVQRRPMVKIGTRSLKALRSSTYGHERVLRTSARVRPGSVTLKDTADRITMKPWEFARRKK